MDPDQTAPIGAVCSGSTLFASILNSSVMLGNYLQQTTFSDAFFLGTLRVKPPTLLLIIQSNNTGQGFSYLSGYGARGLLNWGK